MGSVRPLHGNNFIIASVMQAIDTAKNPWLALASIGTAWFTLPVWGSVKPGQELVYPALWVMAILFIAGLFFHTHPWIDAIRKGSFLGSVPIVVGFGLAYLVVFSIAAIANLLSLTESLIGWVSLDPALKKLVTPYAATVLGYVIIRLNAYARGFFGVRGTASEE